MRLQYFIPYVLSLLSLIYAISSDVHNQIAIPLPLYINVFRGSILGLIVFDIFIVFMIAICFVKIENLDTIKKSLISGFSIFMLVGQLSSFVFKEYLLSVKFIIAAFLGILSGIMTLFPNYCKILYSLSGSYITSYIITAIFRKESKLFFMCLLVIFVTAYCIFQNISAGYHYALCKSLFTGFIFLIFVDITFVFINPFKGLHGKMSDFLVRGILALLMFFLVGILCFFTTLCYDKVQEKAKEVKFKIKEKIECNV